MKKRKLPGFLRFLIVLVIVLAVLIGVPYAYLSLEAARIADMRAAYDPSAAPAADVRFDPDGSVAVTLDGTEIYRLLESYDIAGEIEEMLPIESLRLDAYAVSFTPDAARAQAVMKWKNLVPLPLNVLFSAQTEGTKLILTLREASLGSLIKIPYEKLSGFGVDEVFRFDFGDAEIGRHTTNVTLGDDTVTLTDNSLGKFLTKPAGKAYTRAFHIWVYEGDASARADSMIDALLSREPVPAEAETHDVLKAVCSSDNPLGAIRDLLALCDAEDAASMLKERTELLEQYVVTLTEDEIAPVRQAYIARIAKPQLALETMLTSLRETYKSGGVLLDRSGFLNSEDEKPISLSALCDGFPIQDDASRPMLLFSKDAWHAVRTADMPRLKDVAQNRGAVDGDTYQENQYDIAIVTTLPCDLPAMLYYEANGPLFVINLIGEALYARLTTDSVIPVFLSDELPKPPTRRGIPAPASGLSEYEVLNPQA